MKNNPISFLDVCEYVESKNNSKPELFMSK